MRAKNKLQLGYKLSILTERSFPRQILCSRGCRSLRSEKKEHYCRPFLNHSEFRVKCSPNITKIKNSVTQPISILKQATVSSNLGMSLSFAFISFAFSCFYYSIFSITLFMNFKLFLYLQHYVWFHTENIIQGLLCITAEQVRKKNSTKNAKKSSDVIVQKVLKLK